MLAQASLWFGDLRPTRLAWLPIPLFVLLLLALKPFEASGSFTSPWLLLAVNAVFGTAMTGVVACLLARKYARDGQLSLLAIACGGFFLSVAGSAGAFVALREPGSFDPNTTITIFTACVWLSALCHLVAAVIPGQWRSPPRSSTAALVVAAALCVAMVVYVVGATLTNSLPEFFRAGRGGTSERHWALFSASAMFALTCALFWSREVRSRFDYWYGLGLLLVAVALVALVFLREMWSAYAWICRLALAVAGCYLLAAARSGVREWPPQARGDAPYAPRFPYPVAVLAVVAAAVVRMVFLPEMGEWAPFLVFFPAVTLASVYGGYGPGALAAGSIVIANSYGMASAGGIELDEASHLAAVLVFLASSLLVCWLSETLHRALRRSRNAEAELARRGEQLEETVALRTAELILEVAKYQEAQARAEAANAARARFLAAVSHDLRQPLGALALYVGAAGLPGSKDERLLPNMKRCVLNLTEMLNNLLDLSKLDAAVVKAEPKDFELRAVLAQVIATQRPQAVLKGLSLRCVAGDFAAHTDPVLFGRIVSNLVANAIRYTTRGGVLIGLRRWQGRRWLEVWDTGVGIPGDRTEWIFEEFRQLGNAERNREKGSGLGLAIVAKTAALLGLQVRVRSRLGVGTMFAVEVPGGAPVVEATAQAPGGRTLRIALVEDDVSMFEALLFALRRSGHEVIGAHSGSGLRAELAERVPDIVFSDYALADGETGLDVVGALRGRFGRTLPAIILTGNTDPGLKAAAAASGVLVHHKPVDFAVLERSLEALCAALTGAPAAHDAPV